MANYALTDIERNVIVKRTRVGLESAKDKRAKRWSSKGFGCKIPEGGPLGKKSL